MAEAGICICSSAPLAYPHTRSLEVGSSSSRYRKYSRSRIGSIRAAQLQITLIGRQNSGCYRVRATGRETRTVLRCGGSNGVGNWSPVVKSTGDDKDDDGKVEGSGFSIVGDGTPADGTASSSKGSEGEAEPAYISHLRELLKLSQLELERARENSTKIENEAQRFAERAIALRDQAAAAVSAADATKSLLEDQAGREASVKEALEDAKLLLDAARARLQSVGKAVPEGGTGMFNVLEEVEYAQREIQRCEDALKGCERELSSIQSAKLDLEKESARLSELADAAKNVAAAADEDVATAMVLAEKAVALELEAAERLSDAEIALQKAETQLREPSAAVELKDGVITPVLPTDKDESTLMSSASEKAPVRAEARVSEEKGVMSSEASEMAVEKAKEILEKIKTESEPMETAKVQAGGSTRKDNGKEVMEPGMLKSFTKKSSRFFPASFFSSGETEEFSPSSLFSGLVSTLKNNFPKALAGAALLLGGGFYVAGRMDKLMQLSSYNIEDVTTSTKPIIKKLYRVRSRVKDLLDKVTHQEVNDEEASLRDVLWLLLASVVFVPLFQKIPGGSPVLGYLAAGVLIGPHSLHIIQNVHGTKAIAELGVVFLLFNIGLELSVERLSSMRKYVFGFGSSQVLITALVAGLSVHYLWGVPGPAAIVIGNGLALSSTAVVLQVLQERGESTSRHGRAAFSVLLFQDLAVVVLLILIPLISPNSSKGGVGFNAIAEALGIAAIKGVIAISGIIAGGRLLLRPIYRSMAENHNAEIFAANTLLVVLGTSVLTARAGLSMALGAFLAGLLLSETEFALQVESDIAPYRGLLLGLFFMTVGMSIDPNLFVARFPVIMGSLALLILGKGLLIAVLGRQFGLSNVAAVRAGLLLAPGGEFAFVAFGEAVNQRIMTPQLSSLLFLVVGLSMAVTPWLAAAGQLIATRFEQQDVRSLLPAETETDDLRGHMIVCGFGRVGQIISQMLSERLIPFVALDVRSERVSMGRSLDLPVYFGDAGSKEVLHKLGAERAAAAVITLDTPGANYRAVWALSKHFPNVKTYVRAHDVDHGINLEKAGATAVVPETLEPSLQLAAAILAEAKLPASEIAATINEFRNRHLSELTELTEASGTSLGYGFSQTTPSTSKPKQEADDERRFGGVVAVP